eukprot:1047469-Pleurochrysis_carterae.AAC.1
MAGNAAEVAKTKEARLHHIMLKRADKLAYYAFRCVLTVCLRSCTGLCVCIFSPALSSDFEFVRVRHRDLARGK